MHGLTRFYIQKKYQRVLKSELQKIMNSLLDDSQSMDSIIWQKVIKHMYEEHDYVTLRNLLIEDGEVLYGSLLRRVLNF